MTLELRRVAYEEALFRPFLEEAEADGGRFLFRLRDEWLSGRLRFEGEGEILLGGYLEGELVAIGGLSRDPYHPRPGLGRVRHVFVLSAHRRRGFARKLVERLLDHARGHFTELRLTTQSPAAAILYERLGFSARQAPKETHRLKLQTGER